MRRHVLRVGKSQDMRHGIMGVRRILLDPTGTGALPCLRFKVAQVW